MLPRKWDSPSGAQGAVCGAGSCGTPVDDQGETGSKEGDSLAGDQRWWYLELSRQEFG